MSHERALHIVIFMTGVACGFIVCLLNYARERREMIETLDEFGLTLREYGDSKIVPQGPALDKDQLVI